MIVPGVFAVLFAVVVASLSHVRDPRLEKKEVIAKNDRKTRGVEKVVCLALPDAEIRYKIVENSFIKARLVRMIYYNN